MRGQGFGNSCVKDLIGAWLGSLARGRDDLTSEAVHLPLRKELPTLRDLSARWIAQQPRVERDVIYRSNAGMYYKYQAPIYVQHFCTVSTLRIGSTKTCELASDRGHWNKTDI